MSFNSSSSSTRLPHITAVMILNGNPSNFLIHITVYLTDYVVRGKRYQGSLFSEQKKACALITGYEYRDF